MADYLPLNHDGNGESPSYIAGAPIVGGQLVELSADNTVIVAAADSAKVAGVAAFDVKAGARVTCYRGGVQLIKASGAIAVGDLVAAAAGGTVAKTTAPAAGVKLGKAQAAAANGALVEIVWEVN